MIPNNHGSVPNQADVEAFLKSIPEERWNPNTADFSKALVAGNLNAFIEWYRSQHDTEQSEDAMQGCAEPGCIKVAHLGHHSDGKSWWIAHPKGKGERIERTHAGCDGTFRIFDSFVTCEKCGTPYSSCTVDTLAVAHSAEQASGAICRCKDAECTHCGRETPNRERAR